MDWTALKVWGPSLALVALGFAIAYHFVEPAPPDRLVLGTGSPDGAYHLFGQRYAEVFEREGFELVLRETEGSLDNLRALQIGSTDPSDPDAVDVAFVQGGVADDGTPGELEALASLFVEPLWVFVPRGSMPSRIGDLAGKRLAVGAEGSGTKKVAMQILLDNGLSDDNTVIHAIGNGEALEALRLGALDAAFFVADPSARVIKDLLRDPEIGLMSFERSAAYVQNHRFLREVTLAEGAADLAANLPPRDTRLLAPAAGLIARPNIHPALVDLLLMAATEVHRKGGMFAEVGAFPSTAHLDFDLNSEARRYLSSGPPFLQRYLPFSAANLVDRLAVLLIPLITLLIPLFRILPPMLDWRLRHRVYRWYDNLAVVEAEARTAREGEERNALLQRLDDIETEVSRIPMPISRTDLVYTLRSHIHLVRDKLNRR